MLEEALLGAIVGGAGETGQVDEDGDFLRGVLDGLGRQVEVEGHFAAGGGGGMAELEELSAKGGDGCLRCDGHDVLFDGVEDAELVKK